VDDNEDPVPADVWGDEYRVVREAMDWAEARVVRETNPKTTARSAEELREAAGQTVCPAGIGGLAALRVFTDVLEPATRAQDDPMNLAYVPAAPTRASVAFDFVTSAVNVFGGLWETGAGAIYAENEALAWLVELLGWPRTAGGCFVSGGTSGNLSALVAAREAALARRGSRPAQGWQIVCTSEVHSSVRTTARVLDVTLIEVPGDDRGRLTGAQLEPILRTHPDVFAVVATAGTTNAGLVDDLAGVADACTAHGVWMHVDGAYGGAGLAASSVRALFEGVERADSFIVDPHKWLFAPYDSCALLYRDPASARAAHAQSASYLDQIDREMWNPADLAAHLTRRARGLPFWFSLATHGTDRYAAAVERTLDVSRTVAAAIRSSPHLELVCEPQLSVLLFRRVGWDPDTYSEWSQRLAREGVILCLPTTWQGETVLRLAFVNPATRAERVIEVLETLRRPSIPTPSGAG
jgi:glutamate/tyrosine decarboxylase-like PLP-dependent enzyme